MNTQQENNAKEIGTSHTTVTRIMKGQNTDVQTAIMLLNWLFMPETKEGKE
jgi:hypothetical protein